MKSVKFMNNIIFTVLFSVYVFIIMGFVLHTSPIPVVFGKYAIKYFSFLFFLFLSIFPALWAFKFVEKTSILVLYKKNIMFSPKRKLITILLIFSLFITGAEVFLRMNHISPKTQPYTLSLQNFHPFLQASLRAENNREHPELHINAFGFRGDEITKEKPPNTMRIIVLGGSTVLNVGVPYEQSFGKLLQDDLRAQYPKINIEVLNAGMDGYTSEHSLIQYQFYIKDFHPDLIIVWQGINDMYYSCVGNPMTKGSYQSDYSHYMGALQPVFTSYDQERNALFSFHLNLITFDFLQQFFRYNFYSDINPIYNKAIARMLWDKGLLPYRAVRLTEFPSLLSYTRNMQSFIDVLKYDKVPLIIGNQAFLYREDMNQNNPLPQWFMQTNCAQGTTYPDTSSLIDGLQRFNAATSDLAAKNKVSYIDLEAQIPKTLEYFTDDVHYTARGNARLAELLFTFLHDHRFIR